MKLYTGFDLHSTNSYVGIIGEDGKRVWKKNLRNDPGLISATLSPFKEDISGIVVESTYNWYWLVDLLIEEGYHVHLANPSKIQQYSGLKHGDDEHDAFWLAEMLRLKILPERHKIYCDKNGGPLDSYSKTQGILKDINTDIINKTFKVDEYKTSAREQYYLQQRFEKYLDMQTGMKYRQQFKFAEPYIFGYFSASRDIREVKQSDIALWTENLERYSKKGKLGGKAKKNIVGIMLAMLNYNQGLGVIPKRLTLPRIDIEKKKKDIPDITDSFKIISAIDVTDEERLIYLFLVTHPCRLSEARALQPIDFDFEKQTVTIQRSLEGTKEKDTNKTEKPYTIPLHSAISERIRQLCIMREPTEIVFKFQGKMD